MRKRSLKPPDMDAILGRFVDARCVLETAHIALESNEHCTVEFSALRTGLEMLKGAYNELDRAVMTLESAKAS